MNCLTKRTAPLKGAYQVLKKEKSFQSFIFQRKFSTDIENSSSKRRLEKFIVHFFDLSQHEERDIEFLSAREIKDTFGFRSWQALKNAIKKTMTNAQQIGLDVENSFAPAFKAKNVIDDYYLSSFGCYLLAEHSNSPKAKKIFTRATRTNLDRFEIREQLKQAFKDLSKAAQDVGVQNQTFGIFHEVGYKGLYGGLGLKNIKALKGLQPNANLMDFMKVEEMAYNLFRMRETERKLKKLSSLNPQAAICAHEEIASALRLNLIQLKLPFPENISLMGSITKRDVKV